MRSLEASPSPGRSGSGGDASRLRDPAPRADMLDMTFLAQDPLRVQNQRPQTAKRLHRWLVAYTGVRVAREHVCPGHDSPWDCFRALHLKRPSLALVLGARGAGKSFLSALDTHLTSRWSPRHATRILGGSRAQSLQVYQALRELVRDGRGRVGSDGAAIEKLLKSEARYHNGSEVAILAASSTSVRGPTSRA